MEQQKALPPVVANEQSAALRPVGKGLMWGIFPIGSSILALLVVLIPEEKWLRRRDGRTFRGHEELVLGRVTS